MAKPQNPLVVLRGRCHDESLTCRTCKHLLTYRYQRTIYKCALRGDTQSTATDHRVNWPACSLYKEV